MKVRQLVRNSGKIYLLAAALSTTAFVNSGCNQNNNQLNSQEKIEAFDRLYNNCVFKTTNSIYNESFMAYFNNDIDPYLKICISDPNKPVDSTLLKNLDNYHDSIAQVLQKDLNVWNNIYVDENWKVAVDRYNELTGGKNLEQDVESLAKEIVEEQKIMKQEQEKKELSYKDYEKKSAYYQLFCQKVLVDDRNKVVEARQAYDNIKDKLENPRESNEYQVYMDLEDIYINDLVLCNKLDDLLRQYHQNPLFLATEENNINTINEIKHRYREITGKNIERSANWYLFKQIVKSIFQINS